jgi:HK97 family phage major capsid protein
MPEDIKKPEDVQVIQQVLDQVKQLGDNTKKNRERLSTDIKRNYEDLKSYVDENVNSSDVLVKERIEKLSTDITVKQEELDKKLQEAEQKTTERIDELEVIMKRLPAASNGGSSEEIYKEAKEFLTVAAALQSPEGLSSANAEKTEVNVEAYKKYKDTLKHYFRSDIKLITPEEYKALMVGINPSGGYTVTPAMSNQIIKRIFEFDPIRQLASTETISTNALEWGVDYDEAGASWEEETVVTSDTTTPSLKKKRIPVHTLATRPKVTQQLLEDSSINVESWLANKVADKFMRTEGAAFVSGNGVGKPRGFLTYDDGTSYGQIERVASGAAAAITADGLIDLKYAMTEYYLNRGTFLMNRLTLAEVMKLKDGNGDYIWKPGLTDSSSLLLGLPVRMSTTMPIIAASALSVVLADWKEAYKIVDRLGISIQKDPYTVKPFVEFYTRKRVGGDVVNYEAIKIQVISA